MTKPNILFLSIEDLNDWIEPLGGHPDTITPNLTRLAARTVVFQSAYAAAPACSPSRAATMYGQNPWETGLYVNAHKPDQAFARGARLSVIGQLRNAGYTCHGAGKVFHVQRSRFDFDEWDEFQVLEQDSFAPISQTCLTGDLGPASDFGPAPGTDPQADEINTDWIIARMQAGASGALWALGLYRPHLPFIVPQEYFDALPDVVADPPGLGMNGFSAENRSTLAGIPQGGKRFSRRNGRLGKVLEETGEYKAFLRAYLASISYADALLGRVLDRMDYLNLWDNTITVLWSDHGWQLGEKLAFRKFSLWERALRVPLMIGGPGIVPGNSPEPVSLTDLAPTLCGLAGIPIPDRFSGQNLTPILRGQTDTLRGHAISVWEHDMTRPWPILARTVRSRDWRYILYPNGGEELYDHRTDPYEHANLLSDRFGPIGADTRQRADTLAALLPVDLCPPLPLPDRPNAERRAGKRAWKNRN